MKTAKNFVRRVRSKSPFRRRKRAGSLIAEVRQKEQAFAAHLNSSTDQTSQPDDQAEIEVILESSSCDIATAPATASRTSEQSGPAQITSPRKEDVVPDLVPSASATTASTDDPPLTSAQAAARRFMERQQKLAAGNRRKSFRDRFMRPAKSSNSTPPPPPPSPAKSTTQMGISVRGRTRSSSSFSSGAKGRDRGQGQDRKVVQERGRSKERSTRGSVGKGSKGSSVKSKSSGPGSRNRIFSSISLVDEDEPDEPQHTTSKQRIETGATRGQSRQPVTIEVGNQSRISELSTPAAILRQESLGTESIRGVRQALQKMELELAVAGDSGKRVSRDKIMNALNYMANSLHYDDQKEALVKELDEWIDASVIGGGHGVLDGDDDDDDNTDDYDTSSSASASTFDLDAFDDGQSSMSSSRKQQNQSSFQDLFLRLGKFFTITEEDQVAVKQALDDLLWTELSGNGQGLARRSSRSSKRKDDCESSDGDSIGDFDPLTCNIQDMKGEPAAPATKGRSWWRRHVIGGGSTKIKKENLYPVQEGPPSPESKISVPSPTGKVNPRSSKSRGSGKSSVSGAKSAGSRSGGRSSASTKLPHGIAPPALKTTLQKQTTTLPKSRFTMEESDSGWSSFDETASDFWRQGGRYTIPSKPKASLQQAQLVNHYKLSYPPSWQDSDPFLDSGFLSSPKEDEFGEWDDCLHPAENLNHQRQLPR